MKFVKKPLECHICQLYPVCNSKEIPQPNLALLHTIIDQHDFYTKNQPLVRANDSLDYLYVLRSGSIKAWKIDDSNRERIIDFYFPGELIGLDALAAKKYHVNLTFLERSAVCRIHYEKFHSLLLEHPPLQSHLLTLASSQLQQQMALLNIEAESRLLECLKKLKQRMQKNHTTAQTIKLSMSRTDLANYLDLTAETVSRLFTRLQHRNIIQTKGKFLSFLEN